MEAVDKKKHTLGQHFRSEYSVQFPVITKSHINDQHACCTVCKCDFDISHSGIGDVKKPVATDKHTCKAAAGTGSRKVADFFTGSKDLSVTRADTLFTEYIIEHNLPLACADRAGPIFRKMFPDSQSQVNMAVVVPRLVLFVKH